MRARERVALAGVVLLTGSLLPGQLLVPPAQAATQVAAAPGPGGKPDKPGRKQDDSNGKKKDDKKDGKKNDGKKNDAGPDRPRRDRRAPATPTLGDPGVGPGGAVSLPVIAESGAYVVVAELGGSVVATGTGAGGYSSLGWTTSHGSHSYTVTATDRAGNRSRSAQTSVVVDALPPRLRLVRMSPGTPSDTRSRVVLGTEPGSAYRILVDGRQVAAGRAVRPRVERLLDLADGRHRVQVVVRDAIGNPRSAVRPLAVRIPELAVSSRLTSDPTRRTQVLRVRATPTATRGVVRIPGRQPVTFVVRRGAATVELPLPDDTYRKGTVTVRDTHGRTGRDRVPALTVDTTEPVLDVVADARAAAEGRVLAAVTAEDDATVRWRLLDPAGDVVDSGELLTEDGKGTVATDVEQGSYRLVVAATDSYDRTTTVRTTSQVAEDPWPTWLVVLIRALLTLGVLVALAGLVLLVRWARRPDSPVRLALEGARTAVSSRLQPFLAPVPEAAAAAAGVALFEPDAVSPRVPPQRLPSRSGGELPPEDEVLHRTSVRLYETTEELDDGPVLESRTAELVLARERIALVDDRTGDVWSGRIAHLAHVRGDTTMVLPVGEDGWIGLVYADRELTRPALDLVAADQSERRLSPAGSAGG